ncbi:MAG: family 10 glycosylhydrolase [Bacteroidales bacterium]|nr:family 10 glycosylhydrolase [Bacteroidales bacterium]
MKKLFFGILVGLFAFQIAFAQYPPKREMRANWLTTVWRIDWPSVTVPAHGTESQRQEAIKKQKTELINIFDKMKTANMNTVFFQIRSMSDAMYRSSYENWSSFISSERGADPGWDPLAFAIEESHKRGMELHAWINPYRYSSSGPTHGNLPTDYVNTNPEWLITYDSYTKILNPGIPEVTQRIADIVAEVVTNYDVDGIVFDDYFYGGGGTANSHDQLQYDLYNPKGLSRGDWRRENCNRMIKTVYDRIQSIKPWVTFGVSPAGVAASNSSVAAKYGVPPAPVGTDWQYSGIYSEPLAWLQEGTIDYISPQIYWTTTSSTSYDKLAAWWSMVANKFSKHFYSSHSLTSMTGAGQVPKLMQAPKLVPSESKAYRIQGEEISEVGISGIEKVALEQSLSESSIPTPIQRTPSAANFTFPELGVQVDANRTNDLNGAPGSVFFATKKAVGASFVDYLKTQVFTRPAIQPAIHWKKAPTLNLVNNVFVSNKILSWTHDRDDVKYAIYAVPVAESKGQNLYASSAYLIGVSYSKEFILPDGVSSLTHKIAVSVLDRYRNESAPRVLGEKAATPEAAQLTYPANNSIPIIPTMFRWNAVPDADSYVWEVAEDAQFNNLICAREVVDNQFFSGLQTNILEDKTYYWRVKTKKANAPDIYSEVFSFKGTNFKMLSPQHGAVDLSLTPTFEWMSLSPTAQYTLEISKSPLFSSSDEVFSQTVNGTTFTIPDKVLISETTYYARVVVDDGGKGAISEAISFKTKELEIPIPTIISPVDGAEITGTSLKVEWANQNSKGFWVELSKYTSFPPRGSTVQRTDAFTSSTEFTDLDEGTYYVRLKALNGTGTTEPSPYVTVIMKASTDVKNVLDDNQLAVFLDKESQLHIRLSDDVSGDNVIAKIYNIAGTSVTNTTFDALHGLNNYFTINMQNYPKGVYMLKVEVGNCIRVVKFVKRY